MERRHVLFFVIKLLLLTTAVCALAHTYYLLDGKRGVAAPIATILRGLEIKGGALVATRDLPYKPDEHQVASVFYRLVFDVPMITETAPAPTVIVDTAAKTVPPPGAAPSIMMKSGGIIVQPTPQVSLPFSYSKLLNGGSDLAFSETAIRRYLSQNILILFFYACIFEGFPCAAIGLFSICILAFAAYIFRFERQRRIAHFLRFAAFAFTPIPIGAILIALSDVKIPGAWDILVIVSFAVMLRAVMASVGPGKQADAGGD